MAKPKITRIKAGEASKKNEEEEQTPITRKKVVVKDKKTEKANRKEDKKAAKEAKKEAKREAKTNGEKDGLSDFRVDVRLSEAGLLQFGTVALCPLIKQLASGIICQSAYDAEDIGGNGPAVSLDGVAHQLL